jgi:hypothetical protein
VDLGSGEMALSVLYLDAKAAITSGRMSDYPEAGDIGTERPSHHIPTEYRTGRGLFQAFRLT